MRYDAGFLEAICENPDDDVPRLVYADWLEERGDPRGEFIRLQCTLASMPDDDERRWSLLARERQLLGQHGKGWAGPLRRQVRHYTFRRGFVEAITLPAADFLTRGEELLRLAPVRQVRLLDARPLLADLAASPLLDRLAGLDLRYTAGLDAAQATPLLRSPRLAGLRTLGLRGTGLVSASGVQALAACPHLTNLTTLDLADEYDVWLLRIRGETNETRQERMRGIRLDVATIRTLVEAPTLNTLRSLSLSTGPRFGLSLEAMDTLFASRLFGGLSELELHLTWSQMNRPEATYSLIRRLSSSPKAAGLRRLRMVRNMPILWSSGCEQPFPLDTYLSGLTTLELEGFPLPATWITALADGAFPALGLLRLRRCLPGAGPHREQSFVSLGRATGLPRLAALDLEETPVGPRMIHALTEGKTLLSGLRWLSLSNRGGKDGSPVGSEAIRRLAASPAAAQLVRLDLSNNHVDDCAARALATSPFLGNLAALGLGRNRIGADGAAALATSDSLSALTFLDLRGNPLPVSVRAGLRQRFGYGVRYGQGPEPSG
jgi:uncharacterized protein (TIGR02996 family)